VALSTAPRDRLVRRRRRRTSSSERRSGGPSRSGGRRLTAGGYVYVPAGMPHSVQAGAWGCTFFSVASDTRGI